MIVVPSPHGANGSAPTGAREARPDDKLRAARSQAPRNTGRPRRSMVARISLALHPGCVSSESTHARYGCPP
jgi:hypothetical protein